MHAILALLLAGGVVTDMTPELIREAIAYGAKEKKIQPYKLSGKRGSHGCFGVDNGQNMSRPTIASYTTPFMRVALAAAEAKSTYKEFTAADVTPEMLAPEVVMVAPSWAKCREGIKGVKAVVIVLPGGQVVHPERQLELTEKYSNAYGATDSGQGILAFFPFSAIQEGAEVRVVMDDGQEAKDKFELAKIR